MVQGRALCLVRADNAWNWCIFLKDLTLRVLVIVCCQEKMSVEKIAILAMFSLRNLRAGSCAGLQGGVRLRLTDGAMRDKICARVNTVFGIVPCVGFAILFPKA